MNKITKARKYNSQKLQKLLNEISPLQMQQTKIKMQIATNIENLIRAKKWNKSQFAKKIKKNTHEITKWLSGTHNFTLDELTTIASILKIKLIKIFQKTIKTN